MLNTRKLEKRRRHLLKMAYLAAVLAGCAISTVSHAQTTREWDGSTDGNYNTADNWTDPTVPTVVDQASFGSVVTSQNTVTVTTNSSVDRIRFVDGANEEGFNLSINNNVTLRVQGTNDFNGSVVEPQGVVNSSGLTQTFTLAGANSALNFYGLTADSRSELTNVGEGSAIAIENQAGGDVNFYGFSSAGDVGVTITNANGGVTRFNELSDAGSANLINNSNGTIYFDALSSAGSATITNNANGQITFDGNSTAGSATITNEANGQVLFTGTSKAGSSTITNSGQLTFTGNSGAESSTITNTGVLDFLALSQGGTATIINNADGVVNVNTTINGTDLMLGHLRGAGNVVLTDNLTLNSPDGNIHDTISGVISGGGSLTKEGENIVRLSGDNDYTGDTNVNNGVLSLTGSLTSNTFINRDGDEFGELRGNGTITGNLTNAGGRLAPGDILGDRYSTLTVNGTFDSTNVDSIFVSRIGNNEGGITSNSLHVNGNATLGGAVQIQSDPGAVYLVNNQFTLVETDDDSSLTGTFSGVTSETPLSELNLELTDNGADINGGLSYTDTAAYLHLNRTSLNDLIEGVNLTRNQRAVYSVLNVDNLGDLTDDQEEIINQFIISSSETDSATAASLISGDALTAFPVAAQGVSNRFNQRLLSQVSNGVKQNDEYAAARTPRLVYSGKTYGTLLAQSDGAARNFAAEDAAARRSNIWATIARAKEDTDSDGNGPGFDARATEYQVGINRSVSDRTVVGLSIGKSDGDINVDNRAARGDLDTTSFGAYIRHDNDNLYFSGLLSYSRHDIDSRRATTPVDTARADYDARTIALWGEVGKKLDRGSLAIEPHLSLKLSNTKQDSFSESGVGGLNVGSEKYNTRRLGLGVRVATNNPTAKFRPYGFVGYEREFGDERAELTNSLVGLSSFRVRGSDLGKNIWALRLGTDARISDRFSVVGEIGASWRKNQDSRYIYGGVKYGW